MTETERVWAVFTELEKNNIISLVCVVQRCRTECVPRMHKNLKITVRAVPNALSPLCQIILLTVNVVVDHPEIIRYPVQVLRVE